MLGCIHNAIWQKSIINSDEIIDNIVDAPTLEEAVKMVIMSNDANYAFRRNRELIDLKGKFRSFCFENKNYVIKIVETNGIPCEYINSKKANEILTTANKNYYVPVPKLIRVNNTTGLLYDDYGFTLHENIEKTKSIPLEEIVRGFKKLLECGIEWAGWLPRNILRTDSQLILVDWEDAIFNNTPQKKIGDLTLFKLTLGWSQIYGSINEVQSCFNKALKDYQIYISCNDSFEKAFGHLKNTSDCLKIRNESSKLSLESEGPATSVREGNLSFMDVGHIIDELFKDDISVLYTCCTADIRKTKGDTYFSLFSDAFENVLCLVLKENNSGTIRIPLKNVYQTILLFMLHFFQEPKADQLVEINSVKCTKELIDLLKDSDNISSYLIKFLLCNNGGLDNAVKRSYYIHQFLEKLFNIVKKHFTNISTTDLLLRGSCAQGLMTVRSDVDFEVSGVLFPNGHIGIEKLISNILNVFEICNEGSWGRPEEIDIQSKEGFTRDYHEWMELTRPNVPQCDKGWLSRKFEIRDEFWTRWSTYERQPHHITPKFLFFKIRSLLLRLIAKNNIDFTFITDQLTELNNYLDTNVIIQVEYLLNHIIEIYENEEVSLDSILLENEKIDNLYKIINLKVSY